MAHIKYLPDGIRLHIKEFFYKMFDDLSGYYYFSFKDIPTGLKAEKILKKENIKSIPVPDEIFKKCGIAILTKEKDKIASILKENNIEFEIWEKKERFVKLK